jgi:hypothetical protein
LTSLDYQGCHLVDAQPWLQTHTLYHCMRCHRGALALYYHDLLAEEHTPGSETQRERVVRQGSLNSLDG